MIDYIYLTILFPLLGFLINGLVGRKIKNEKIIGSIGAGAVGLAFLVTLFSFIELLGMPSDGRTRVVELFTWLKVAGLNIKFA